MRFFLITIFIFCINISKSQNVLVIDTSTNKVDLLDYSYIYIDSNSIKTINDISHKDWSYFGKIPSFFPSNNTVWIKYSFVNNYERELTRVLFIPYFHIHTIDAYLQEEDSIIQIAKTGLMRNEFSKKSNIIGYPINLTFKPNSTETVYIKYNQLYRPLRATAFLLKSSSIDDIGQISNSFLWFWRGIYGFSLVITLLIFAVVRIRIFLYYGLLILGINLFVFSHVGDIFLFMNSDPTDISSAIDYTGAFLISFSLILLLNELTPMRENNAKMWRFVYYLIYGMLPFVFLSYFPAIRLSVFTYVIHNYIMFVSAVVFISQMYFLIRNIYLKERNAIILTVIYVVYLSAGFVDIILPNIAILGDSVFVYTSFLSGTFFEVFFFMLLIIKETSEIYTQRTMLINKQKEHQKEIILTMVRSQEEERNRTGCELHDLIGANMSIIKQRIKNDIELNPIIDQTIKTIRNLSHGLVSPMVDNDEFVDEVNQMAHLFSTKKQKVYVYFHKWSRIKNIESATHIYRIFQELLQNAHKHSKASNVYIQFIGQNNNGICLYYEDNGIGFNKNKPSNNGLGIRNIKNRVRLLNGNLEIESSKNIGTIVNIEFVNI